MDALRRLGRPALLDLADALDGGRVRMPFRKSALTRHVPERLAEELRRELTGLQQDGFGPRHLARVLRLLAAERGETQSVADRVDLVWSGTEVPGAMSRETGVVVRELFCHAKRSVLVSSYALDRGEKAKGVFGTLARRMDEDAGLAVRLFVNVHRPHGDETPDAGLLRAFAATFRREVWPGSRLPDVFYDPRSLAVGGTERACLHAKCVVVDAEKVFVTSANFTEAAHARNIEAGVVITAPTLARALAAQFETLVARGLLKRVPGL